MKLSPKQATIVILLYAGTWVGGWHSHATQLQSSAQKLYHEAREEEASKKAFWREKGFSESPESVIRPQGPKTDISWSLPILPGILIADSSFSIGPLWGEGGIKIVIYYGFGSFAIGPIWGWMA